LVNIQRIGGEGWNFCALHGTYMYACVSVCKQSMKTQFLYWVNFNDFLQYITMTTFFADCLLPWASVNIVCSRWSSEL